MNDKYSFYRLLVALVGLGLVGYGLYLFHPALAFIVVGAVFVAAAVVGEMRRPPQ